MQTILVLQRDGSAGRFRHLICLIAVWLWVVTQPALVCAEELRDPFTFGPRTDQLESRKTVLGGILWDPKTPLAIVGEQTVGVGDRIGDWLIMEIHPDGLVIQRGDERTTLSPGDAIPE
jgi:hypothetical protein